MEFARRGRATAADDEGVVEEGRCFLDPPPPPHGDALLVIRDALLLQLQQDRLRQEIIVAELAKIDRAMALSSTSCHGIVAGDVQCTKLPSFFGEKFMPHRRWPVPVSLEHWADADFHHDLKEGVRQGVVESRTMKSAMEDRFGECSRPCCTGKEHGQNAKIYEQRLQESEENMQHKESPSSLKWELTGITMPVKKPKSRQKWSCTICHVETPSERHLLEHLAGRRHRSNMATLESRNKTIGHTAETTTEPSLCTGQKTCAIKWSCSTCQAYGTSEGGLKEHLNSSAHQQNIEEKCKEPDGMVKIAESQEAKSHLSNVPQSAEKPPPIQSCSICQTNCDHQSDLVDHLDGKIHQLKIQVLHEVKQTENIPPRIDKNQPDSVWPCVICKAKCHTELHFEEHCRGKRHLKKIAALQREGAEAKSIGLKMENKVPSNGSDSMTATSDKVKEQVTPCVCDGTNLLCRSENICADHCSGQEHLEKQKLLNFCEVCDLQCSSEKMLVHHCTGKKHLKKLNANK